MVDPYAGTGVRKLYKALTDWVQPQIGQGVTPYPGQMVPGVSPIQQQGFGLTGDMGPMVTGPQQFYQNMLTQVQPGMAGRGAGLAEETLGDILKPFDPASATEFWETSFKRPALETWREDIMPAIMEKGVRSAGTADSGPMKRELARSGETLSTNLSAQLANLLYSGEQAQLGRQERGVGQAMNLAGLPSNLMAGAGQVGGMGTDILSQMLNIGGVQRGITGEQLQEPFAKWQSAQPWNNPILQNFLGTALSQPPMEVVAQQQGPGAAAMLPGLGSMIGGSKGGFLGGSGGTGGGGIMGSWSPTGGTGSDIQLAMQIAAMFSDVRIKENIKPVTDALDKVAKLSGYSYNYKFNAPGNRNGGVMAQDVEKVLPDAVSEINGVKFVRYDAVVGLLVEAIKELHREIIGSN